MVKRAVHRMLIVLLTTVLLLVGIAGSVAAQATEPSMLHSSLGVRAVATGLTTPIGVAFLAENDLLVIEKNTGRVQRIVDGAAQSTVLDLAVNFASERGLLGITLHPNFPEDPGVYLFWTCTGTPPPAENPYFPIDEECADEPALGPDTLDTNNILAVSLLGNRVDRFTWDGSALSFDRNLIKLRAFQHDAAPEPPGQGDAAQPPRGNHNGGVIGFGPDSKLYTRLLCFSDSNLAVILPARPAVLQKAGRTHLPLAARAADAREPRAGVSQSAPEPAGDTHPQWF